MTHSPGSRTDLYLLSSVQPSPQELAAQTDIRDNHCELTMMERRPWTLRTERFLPLRYRDTLPQPPPPAPPSISPASPLVSASISPETSVSGVVAEPCSSNSPRANSGVRHLLKTIRNKFGLFRQFSTSEAPSHDPEAEVTPEALSDVVDPPKPPSSISPENMFHPYPNRNAFRLGDWYWNGGAQKSQSSFKELIEIVGDTDFSPSDVRDVNWNHLNQHLAEGDQWLDEDAGWERTPVTISVLFQPRRNASTDSQPNPGPRDFLVTDFYHRSILSIIQEKLANPVDDQHFHYEPYSLHWQPDQLPDPVKVYSEFYTSPAFMDAHRDLQSSPPERGCNLQRCIVALMFASDATQLCSHSEVKLWPLYLFFGNESKYRRCKPTDNLCNHVAYFQGVSDISMLLQYYGVHGDLLVAEIL